MPRTLRKVERNTEAIRLRRLREIMGYTQRQAAGEFRVAHGAIASWESGSRTMPGPAVRLMELFEAELGIEGCPDGLRLLKTSTASRSLALSQMAAKTVARAVSMMFESMFTGKEQAGTLKTRARAAMARNIAQALGELKGVAMKAGQILACADFALPPEVRHEFEGLLTASRPLAPSVSAQVVLEDFGEPPGRIFGEWEPMPFAAASIGQVHRARLRTGETVAVKVQYPAITETLHSDLKNAARVDRLCSSLFRGQCRGVVVEELREQYLEECDYRREAANQEAFRKIWAGRRGFRIPRVYPELSSKRVLVTEYINGETFGSFLCRASQNEKDQAGAIIWEFVFASIFGHGLFYADPLPGNYLFADGEVIFLDFGCVKRFSPEIVRLWRDSIRALLEKDSGRVRELWIRLGVVPNAARFDFDYNFRALLKLYAPCLREGDYRFTPAHLKDNWRTFVTKNPNLFVSNLPKDFVSAKRLWGLGCVLARLQAGGNFRRKWLELMYDSPKDYPPAYSEDELRMLGLN